MNLNTHFHRALALAGLLFVTTVASASPLPAGTWESADIHIVVQGTSTLHDWKVESRTATGEVHLSGDGMLQGFLRVPARSLAGGPNGLNDRMYAALKAVDHPAIEFNVTSLKLPTEARASEPPTWPVKGRLTIAGGTSERIVTSRVLESGAGSLVLETEVVLKMTEFGIKPPTFMGMVRTGDEVTVRVRWTLRPERSVVAD